MGREGGLLPSSEMEDEDREEKAGYFTVVVLSLEIQESARVRGKLRQDDNNGTAAVLLDSRLF
jgi:hypothetical protein